MNIIIIGPPGSGKGTLAKALVEKYNLIHISTGELLRKEMADKTPLGIEITEIMNSGNYVSDEIVTKILEKAISEASTGFILDGYPRTVPQIKLLQNILDKYKHTIDYCFRLVVSHDTILFRITNRNEGRPEDSDMVAIKERFERFEKNTEPVIEQLKILYTLHTVNGEKHRDEVSECVLKILEK